MCMRICFYTRKTMKLIILPILILMLQICGAISNKGPPLAPALYVFGDSLFDSGNNNLLLTLSKANYEPYGMNFVKGPTGRFTNGRTLPDFIAEFLGLPYSATYMNLEKGVVEAHQLSGLNYASSACGILPDTGSNYGKCLNLGEQVDYFQKTVKQELPKHYKNSDELSTYLSKSVFIIATGNNDYIANYNKILLDTTQIYTPQYFATLLINKLSHQLQRLYESGARKVVMFEIGPIGCMPSITRQLKKYNGCVEEINQFILIFNKQLGSLLRNLTSTLRGSSFILGRTYGVTYDAFVNPSKYGVSDTTNTCCVAWFNGTSACVPGFGSLSCEQPGKYYFFDGFHLTETLYKTVATLCYRGPVCTPKNIKDLVGLDS